MTDRSRNGGTQEMLVEHGFDVPLVDLIPGQQVLHPQLRAAFERVLASARFGGGDEVRNFEAELGSLVGTSYAVGVASGTAALQLALLAAGIGTGDDVILPPNSFFATAEAVMATGARPVFADVELDTALLDPVAVEEAITPRTAAIIAVHLYGQPARVDALREIANRYHLFFLEDAAQAITATWEGRSVGSFGDAAAFSFFPAKNLGALGEAGAVTTDDGDLAHRVALLRSHGEVRKNVHVRYGFNERLDALQAAFLLAKLPYLEEAQRFRLQAVSFYKEMLAGTDDVRFLETDPRAAHSYHLLVVRVPRRDQIFGALRARGIEVGIHYPTPIHLQPACHHLGARPGQFPHAEELARSILSLPLFPGISAGQLEHAVRCVQDALRYTA